MAPTQGQQMAATSQQDQPSPKSKTKQNASRPSPQFKMGTFTGVFLPTSLNFFSIIVFLRFSFVLGQAGILGFFAMLAMSYFIDLLTVASLSAIATNGKVRGGGQYYLLSRSLGPEFGGAIGISFYLAMCFIAAMNSEGLIDALKAGQLIDWLPQGYWYEYLWATVLLLLVTAICLAGTSLFAKATNALFVVILVSIWSIPVTAIFKPAYDDPSRGIVYTGINSTTFRNNLYPNFVSGADGSSLPGQESWRSVFGVLFPSTAGIFAGASMSGDLKNPGRSIPNGTLAGMAMTLITYSLIVLSLGSTVTRQSMYNDSNIIHNTNLSGSLILVGELSVTFFGALFSVIGSAKILQAIARDDIIPGLKMFGQGSGKNDEPRYAIFLTYAIVQCAMILDINQIAGFVTMAFLLTFLVTNLACFLLKIGSAPNFRPSFKFFGWQTALIGTIFSCAIMVFVDQTYAIGALAYMILSFIVIHYSSEPKAWGDVSQSLIYHQVRKYLLRLRSDHVKFWRPSVLLLINDPRSSFKLIQFCNSLKKGALFILGHVIVADDFKTSAPEAKRQLDSWSKYIDFSKIKAFTNISIQPSIEWGIRNLVLTSGLGGMRPNIVVLGFFNLEDLRKKRPLIPVPSPQPSAPVSRKNSSTRISSMWSKMRKGTLPTDADKREGSISPQSYVSLLEDMLHGVRINVAIAKGFEKLHLPDPSPPLNERFNGWLRSFRHPKDLDSSWCIDLWPIQMSSFTQIDDKSVLTSNFDSMTLILQLGAILDSVESWKRSYKLRVSVFVEYETEVDEERQRVHSLLANLRIEAEVRVFWLAEGNLKTYECVVNGKKGEEYDSTLKMVDSVLQDEAWWSEVQESRKDDQPCADLRELAGLESAALGTPALKNMHPPKSLEPSHISIARLKKVLKNMKRGIGHLENLPPGLRLRVSPWDQQLIDHWEENDEEDASEQGDDDSESVSSRATSIRGQAIAPHIRRGDIQESFLSEPRRTGLFSRADSTPGSPSKPITIHSSASASDAAFGMSRPRSRSSSKGPTPTFGTPSGSYRPFPMRHQSLPKFTSRPVPPTKISHDHETGPSITFAEHPDQEPSAIRHFERLSRSGTPPPRLSTPPLDGTLSPPAEPETDLALIDTMPGCVVIEQPEEASAVQATGFPFMSSIALSFNDLPARAQNLILNDLMVQNSADTAVLFTTLASPVEGTGDSEEDSVRYLSDLEVLCQGLPPVLLVHCNTVTVTVSL